MKTAATHLPHRHLMVWSVIFLPLQSYAFLVQKNLSHGSNIINISRPSQWSSLFSDPTNENQDSSPKVPDEDDSRPPDIRMFLNQRSIQSFMFLLTQTRDPHTIKWLDDFTRPTTGPFGEGTKGYDEAAGLARSEENDETLPSTTVSSQASAQNDKKLSSRLLYYHGTSGMNVTVFPTWDAYFRQLLEAPGKEITIDSGRGEYVIDIEPARICSRILSVRNQISKEWEKDLLAVLQMKKSIMHSYREREARRNLEAQAELESRRVEKKEKEGDKDIEGLKEERKGTVKGESKWVRVAPLMSSATTPGFDRQPLFFLESDPYDDSGLVASPLRKSSFDLLLLLATREALRRILDHKKVNWEVRSDNENSAAKSAVLNASQISFLKQFYEERREKYFLGRYRRYGLADDFVEELMTHPPRMTTMIRRKEKIPVLLDPAAIAEAVLDKRGEVATEWAKEASLFPGEHAEIQKLQLNRMMGL